MRNGLWIIVVGGVVGTMLAAGLVWAGSPPVNPPSTGGLPACVAKLNTCNVELATCTTDLVECLAESHAVFPGDGVDGPALSYTDHGDGTVTDNNTLLIWEVKDSGSGIHGVGRTFRWTSTGSAADGTAFTVFLDTLNNKCDGDETTACTSNAACTGIGNGLCGHAGHRDWRMPNVKELQSIVDYSKSFPGPTIAASFPGATAAGDYWSSTTDAGVFSAFAWVVFFNDGIVNVDGNKFTLRRVRAVRGGR